MTTAVTDEQVRAALAEFVTKHISICFVGVVLDNSKAAGEGTVSVVYNGVEFSARVQAVTGKTDVGFVPVPKKGSEVFCVSEGNSDNSFIVAACSELEKAIFNGGQLGGLVRLQELKDNLDSLKQYIEAIHSALPAAFNAIGAGTAANGTLGATSYQGAMVGKLIQIKDMEDKKVLH
jgi:hypothetical protein